MMALEFPTLDLKRPQLNDPFAPHHYKKTKSLSITEFEALLNKHKQRIASDPKSAAPADASANPTNESATNAPAESREDTSPSTNTTPAADPTTPAEAPKDPPPANETKAEKTKRVLSEIKQRIQQLAQAENLSPDQKQALDTIQDLLPQLQAVWEATQQDSVSEYLLSYQGRSVTIEDWVLQVAMQLQGDLQLMWNQPKDFPEFQRFLQSERDRASALLDSVAPAQEATTNAASQTNATADSGSHTSFLTKEHTSGPVGHNPSGQDPSGQDPSGQDSTSHDSTSQGLSGHDLSGQDSMSHDSTSHDSTSSTEPRLMVHNFRTESLATKAAQQYQQLSHPVSRVHIESMLQGLNARAAIALRNGDSEMRMLLNPPELGSIRLSFKLTDGLMTGKIIVGTEEARLLFQENFTQFQRSMEQLNLKFELLDLSMGSDGQQFDSENPFAPSGAPNEYRHPFLVGEDETTDWASNALFRDKSINFIA